MAGSGWTTVDDRMQRGYCYELTAPPGEDFDPAFRPELTPAEMLELGVFGGKYLTDCQAEFPTEWFANARLSPLGPRRSLNHFGILASQPIGEWRRKGWLHPDDPRGWFQWYCRYFMGRRHEDELAPDQALAQFRPSRRPGPPQLRAGRSLLPAETAPGLAAMGL